MSVFVNILGNGPGYDTDAQRLVRSQAMKDFRHKQREAERQRWMTASRVAANAPRDLEKSGSKHAARDGQGTTELRHQMPDLTRALDDISKADQAPSACIKQFSMPRFIPIPSSPPDERRSRTRKDSPVTRQYASADLLAIAKHYATYLSNNIGGSVRSPEAYRQQLMLPFIELHYSEAMPSLNLAFPKIHARLKPLRTAGIKTAATDAVLLQALAISSNDDSLMWAARRKNNEAIGGLRNSLTSPELCASDEVLLTTDALAFFDAGSIAWKNHASGLSALIAARGPNIHHNLPFLLHALVFQLLGDALLWRGPFVFGQAQWLDAMLPTCNTRMNRLIYLGCRVPDIMKQNDQYLSQLGGTTSDLDSLMHSINRLESSLQDWLSDWYLDEFQNRPPYAIALHTARLDVGLPTDLDKPLLLGSYTFPSLREAFGHNCFWTLLLQVRQARYELLASAPTSTIDTQAAAHKFVCEAADSICRTAPFILRNVSGLPGGLACSAGPLILAGRWYKMCDKPELATWCFATADQLTANMSQPPGWITRSCAAWITAAL
jgi:hypothetical protein